MIFPDYHLHSSFSEDSDEDLYAIIETAKKKSMDSVCITDHYDMDFPVLPQAPSMRFDLDVGKYIETLTRIRTEAAPFDLRIGIELGVMPETTGKLQRYVKEHPFFDFIIASVHLVDGTDPYYPEYFSDKTEYTAFLKYFEAIVSFTKEFTDFDVCGHLDYIVRYGPNRADNYRVSDYADLFRELFDTIVPMGKGIEINTGCMYKGLGFPHPHPDILKLYKEAGGEIITVGSDAHEKEFIGYGFDTVKDILTEHGFRYYCTYKNRKPTFHKIT